MTFFKEETKSNFFENEIHSFEEKDDYFEINHDVLLDELKDDNQYQQKTASSSGDSNNNLAGGDDGDDPKDHSSSSSSAPMNVDHNVKTINKETPPSNLDPTNNSIEDKLSNDEILNSLWIKYYQNNHFEYPSVSLKSFYYDVVNQFNFPFGLLKFNNLI